MLAEAAVERLALHSLVAEKPRLELRRQSSALPVRAAEKASLTSQGASLKENEEELEENTEERMMELSARQPLSPK